MTKTSITLPAVLLLLLLLSGPTLLGEDYLLPPGLAPYEEIDGAPALKMFGREFSQPHFETPRQLSSESGSIEFEFRPGAEFKPAAKVMLSSFFYSVSGDGSLQVGINHGQGICYPFFYLGNTAGNIANYGIYQPFELQAGQWHKIKAAWTSEAMYLLIDGKLIGQRNKDFPVSFGKEFFLGGNPDNPLSGYLRNFKISSRTGFLPVGYRLDAGTSEAGRLYRSGETARLVFDASSNMEPLNSGSIEYRLTQDGLDTIEQRSIDLASGRRGIEITSAKPGFVRCHAILKSDGKTVAESTVTLGFDVDRIVPGGSKPADFDEFWRRGLAELDRIPVDVKITPAADLPHEKLNLFRISFANVGNSRIYGFLAIPKRFDKPLPGIVCIPGAGPGVSDPRGYFLDGAISLFMNVHAYEAVADNHRLMEVYRRNYGDLDYCFIGKDSPRRFYFRRVFLGFYRGIEYLASRPEFDGRNLGITGSSQGGGSSIVMAGLNNRITYVVANVPALCDLGAKSPGWPALTVKYPGDRAAANTGNYFDAAFFATRIKCPVVVLTGYNDPTCNPGSIYAMFNSLATTSKSIIPKVNMAHEWPVEYDREYHKMLTSFSSAK